jgi:vitamin B12 transporter
LNSFFGLGNPDLKPERSIAFDAGIDQTFAKDKMKLAATYFYTEIRDEIAYLPTANFNDPSYFNFDKHFSRGLELSADASPTDSTRFFASYTFINSDVRNFHRVTFASPLTVASADKKAFGIPNHQFTFVFTQSIKRLTLNFDFLATSSYLAPVFSNAVFDTYTYRFKGARRADVTAAYEIPMRNDKLRFRLFGTIENLFDHEYYENGFQTAGRTARGGIGISF